VDGLDVGEFADLVLLEPGEEVAGGPVIGQARILLRIVAAKNSMKRREA
jgi:hypothetical protein